MFCGKQSEVRKADELFVADDTPILGWVRPLLAEVFCGGGCYRGPVLPDVSLPKLYARARPKLFLHHADYLVGYHHEKLISSYYE